VRKKNNTIYLADELLFSDNTIPGCGYFPKLKKDLLLTASTQEPEKWIASRWNLPGFFYRDENRPSVLKDRKWDMRVDGSCLVETSGRWQEAVSNASEDFCRWFRRLLESIAGDL
jgi:hypothetical protein